MADYVKIEPQDELSIPEPIIESSNIDEYLVQTGWEKTGIPLKECLIPLGPPWGPLGTTIKRAGPDLNYLGQVCKWSCFEWVMLFSLQVSLHKKEIDQQDREDVGQPPSAAAAPSDTVN